MSHFRLKTAVHGDVDVDEDEEFDVDVEVEIDVDVDVDRCAARNFSWVGFNVEQLLPLETFNTP